MYDMFINYLSDRLEKDIQKNIKENKNVQYEVNLMSIENIYGDQHCVFEIFQSQTKGKLKENLKIEEKVKIVSTKVECIGTIMDIVENNLHILLPNKIVEGKYTITRLTNFNNNILRKELKKLKVGNLVDEFVFTNFLETILQNLELIVKVVGVKNMKSDFIVLYILLLEGVHDINRNILIDKLFKSCDNVKIQSIKSLCIGKCLRTECESSYCYDTIDKIYDFIDQKRLIENSNIDLLDKFSHFNIKEKSLSYFNNKLNQSQKTAVKNIVDLQNYKIIGPPGTGKTSTIIEIILQLLRLNMKILVCGPSNISIDNLINKYISSKFYKKTPVKFYRRGSSFKGLVKFNLKTIVDEYTKFLVKEKGEKGFNLVLKKMKRLYREKIESETRLVFSTTFSSLRELYDFDWVIVDEACQSSAVETFLSIRHGKKFILVGDPNQLCHESRSLFELLSLKTHFLNIQYRMCDRLISFSNQYFYNSKIVSHINTSYNVIESSPLVFVDTKTINSIEESVNSSKTNHIEAKIVEKLVSFIKSDDIGVITPYSAQVLLLKELLPKVEIATVDGFQGREKEFIIISLVRSNDEGSFGFLANFKRLNVSLTRCKKGLIVVGNSDTFRKCRDVNNFIKFVEKHFISIDPVEIDEYFKSKN